MRRLSPEYRRATPRDNPAFHACAALILQTKVLRLLHNIEANGFTPLRQQSPCQGSRFVIIGLHTSTLRVIPLYWGQVYVLLLSLIS